MSSSVLAFLATSTLFDETETEQTCIITLVVGVLSTVVVFLQTMSGICLYGSRAAMHNATVISFRTLRDDLNMRSYTKRTYDNHDDKDSDDENDGDTDLALENNDKTFGDLRIRFKQCQNDLHSVVPMPISDAFHSVDSNLMTMRTEHNIVRLKGQYGMLFTPNTHDLMYSKAFDILVNEFLESKAFPFFLPNPNDIVDKTMKKLSKHMRGINDVENDDEEQGGTEY